MGRSLRTGARSRASSGAAQEHRSDGRARDVVRDRARRRDRSSSPPGDAGRRRTRRRSGAASASTRCRRSGSASLLVLFIAGGSVADVRRDTRRRYPERTGVPRPLVKDLGSSTWSSRRGPSALVLFGEYTLMVRSAMLETLGEDYILTSGRRALSNWSRCGGTRFATRCCPWHARRALARLTSWRARSRWSTSSPGRASGWLVVAAVTQRDYPVLQAAFLLLTLSVIFFNLVADLLYFKLNPRVTE